MGVSEGIEGKVRQDLASLGGYVPSKAPENVARELGLREEDIIKLDDNENPYGCSPRVQQALGNCTYLYTYPDAGQTELRRQLQEYIGVDASYIVADNGSDQLIDNVLRLFLEPGDELINAIPTFDIFRVRALVYGGKLVNVPRDEDFVIDAAAIKAAVNKNTKMIVLATPNNPTGTITHQPDILELADTGIPLLVDEAYVEFSGETVTKLVNQYKNMMVLRTFSKWAGLAGLRIGYGVFPPKIAEYLMKLKLPYNVSVAARVAVRETLKDTQNLMSKVKAIVAERERLFTELGKLDWLKPFPSQANFVFCHVLKGKASDIQQALHDRGILIRYFDLPLLQNSIRISVGKPEHTDALLKALREIGS
ncbi:MAG TPA: histidinol-phosphate transaminase [Dehalococcoidia bacterium]|nr:histidinol-phosphate transaminase [Dehalococcoidia bacterium]